MVIDGTVVPSTHSLQYTTGGSSGAHSSQLCGLKHVKVVSVDLLLSKVDHHLFILHHQCHDLQCSGACWTYFPQPWTRCIDPRSILVEQHTMLDEATKVGMQNTDAHVCAPSLFSSQTCIYISDQYWEFPQSGNQLRHHKNLQSIFPFSL